jgi:ADP-heptose:LPS heptosyltransferase
MNCDERGMQIIENNPHVKYILPHKAHSIPNEGLDAYWTKIAADYDYTARLSGTVVEGQLLFISHQYMWYAGDRLRRRAASKHNYYEKMVKTCGFEPIPPVRGEIYFTKAEREWAKRLIKKHFRRKYIIVWAWTGSAIHKTYAHTETVMKALLDKWPDLIIITTGDVWCQIFEEDHPRIMHTSGEWTFRQSMSLIPYADLVVGPETGMLNAAGCFDTPKICMLSHSTKENLTKHWANDYSFQAPCECSPCHRLFKYTGSVAFSQGMSNDDYDVCPKDSMGLPVCMTATPPEMLIEKIEEVRKIHG